jgi:DNA adenine methylase
LFKGFSKTTIINDSDAHLIAFWKTLQDAVQRKQLISLLDGMLYSRAAWYELRARWKSNTIPDDPVKASAEWYFLNRATYAADMQGGGFIGYAQGRNMCKTFRNAVGQLHEAGELVKGWIIENLPFQECIKRFDGSNVVFFADAPYFLPGQRKHYQQDFTLGDHETLAKLLANIKGRALVSHYENDTISELYSGWNCYKFESFTGSSNGESKPKTVECLWTNFEARKTQKVLFPGVNP